jgi:hypothetical protein
MVAANQTFIHEILTAFGLENVFADRIRYPEIAPEELKTRAPAMIFLSSEPYPFTEKHLEEFRVICPDADIRLVNGEMFSWYGSRLRYAVEYFNSELSGI